MRSITTLDLQYAHRFYGFKGEAQYLHGHTGVLTIEVEDTINDGDTIYVLKNTKIYLDGAEINFASATTQKPAENDGFSVTIGSAAPKALETEWTNTTAEKYTASAEYTVSGDEAITINLTATTT